MGKIVPWTQPSEWNDVKGLLYADNKCDRELGLKRVCAWMSRGRVPVSVEATAVLVESESRCRLKLSMAIVRFVNLVLDQEQKQAFAQSALSVAASVGLPSWLVEIRHQATHDKLPTLVLLQAARKEALNWLYDCYWSKQESSEKSAKRNIQICIKSYLLARKTFLKSKEKNNDIVDTESNQHLMELKKIVTIDNCKHLVSSIQKQLIQTSLKLNFLYLAELLNPFLSLAACTWNIFIDLFLEHLILEIRKTKTKLNQSYKELISKLFFNVSVFN